MVGGAPNNSTVATKICHSGEVYWIQRKDRRGKKKDQNVEMYVLQMKFGTNTNCIFFTLLWYFEK